MTDRTKIVADGQFTWNPAPCLDGFAISGLDDTAEWAGRMSYLGGDSPSRLSLSHKWPYAPVRLDFEQTSTSPFEISHSIFDQFQAINLASVVRMQSEDPKLLVDPPPTSLHFLAVVGGTGFLFLVIVGVSWRLSARKNRRLAWYNPPSCDRIYSPIAVHRLIDELRELRAIQPDFDIKKSPPPSCRRFLRDRRYGIESRMRRQRRRQSSSTSI